MSRHIHSTETPGNLIMHRYRTSAAGFTLMELMITVAIVGILAAIAYPSYSEQVARSRRSDAKAALMDAAHWMERQYTVSSSYAAITDSSLPPLRSPLSNYYTLSLGTASAASAPTASAYWLRVVPRGTMSNDRCGTMSIDSKGLPTVSGTPGVDGCWNR